MSSTYSSVTPNPTVMSPSDLLNHHTQFPHMLEYAKNKKISDFINLDKPDIFSELEESLKPESSEEATAEIKIVYNIKITAWKIKYMKYEKINEDDIKETDIAEQFNLKKDFLNVNLAIDADYAQA
ncbi:uncharacterized protein BDCG_16242 [Blastomyces dermatitidis ER-3]|uniref:Uncharacterized protein n=1 Tax=Ajellomyces dermatitidis (strain ER-3 / ATCC MYA-2586) TaxID=559297 RepID=A0ABX2VRS3_AJEDR|nr:uncharacterized protein BDCG_16242 [Blastomyces dermatitidis ER-3]OAS99651.1 hypothetical protein BDCG_16242 [Blastomyces dermatitidis ER-3]